MKAEIKLPSIPNFYIDVLGTPEEILQILIMINEGGLLVEAQTKED